MPEVRRQGLFGAVVAPFQAFLKLEAASGIVLLASAVAALVWANVHPASYREVFELRLSAGEAQVSLRELVNDVLMAIFFFVVGMEIKRELVSGALNSRAKAMLPAIAAIGGMVVPALIFVAFNPAGAARAGWGVPMATDIAFCVGVLTLLKGRVPHALIVFVTALAIFDDIGGILVIAFFYGQRLNALWLLAAGGVVLVLGFMNRRHVVNGVAYSVAGAALWYALHHGGIHATLSGVVLGLMIPSRAARPSREVLSELSAHVSGLAQKPHDEDLDAAEILAIEEKLEDLEAPLRRFVHLLHPYVAFGVMPLFALASSGVEVDHFAVSTVGLGVAMGLLLGKPIGIFSVALAAVKLKLAPMPEGGTYAKLFGVSVAAGIGFTVALFIATLAYPDPALLEQAKLGVLLGSAAAGLVGAVLLGLTRKVAA